MSGSPLAPLRVVGAAIVRGARCLVTQRGAAMTEPLKWEFPGGKVEPGETPREALRREIREELGLEVEVGERLGGGAAASGRRRVELEVYLAVATGGALRLAEHREHRWIGADQVGDLDWADADRPVLPALRRRLRPAAEGTFHPEDNRL